MILHEGQVYRCLNPICAAEIKVVRTPIDGDFTPKCCCGSDMKKPYLKPVLKIIAEDDQAARVFIAGIGH